MNLRMRLVDGRHLVVYQIKSDGSDVCRVCFAAREFAVGHCGQLLDGCMVVIKEIVLPDDENSAKRQLFHCNRGYAMAEVQDGAH
jgi:hypothetical protein